MLTYDFVAIRIATDGPIHKVRIYDYDMPPDRAHNKEVKWQEHAQLSTSWTSLSNEIINSKEF